MRSPNENHFSENVSNDPMSRQQVESAPQALGIKPLVAQQNPPEGLTYQSVIGDGDCLYSAVNSQLNLFLLDPISDLRERTAEHITKNPGQFSQFMPDGVTVEKYADDIKSNRQWADNIEIVALMQVLNRPIVVIGPDNEIRNRVDLANYINASNPIFVRYNGHNHYDALLPNENANAGQIFRNLYGDNDIARTSQLTSLPPDIEAQFKPLMEAMSQPGAAGSDALKKYLTLRTKQSVPQIEIDQYLLNYMESIDLTHCNKDIILALVEILNRKDKMPNSTIMLDKFAKACGSPTEFHLHASYLYLKKQYQDNETLAKIYRFSLDAAQQGHTAAQIHLGWMYQNGLGIPADEIPQKDQIAVKWLRLAAEQGHADAQYNLGLMYQQGLGIPADEIPQKDQIAVKWFRLAAEQGHAAAQSHLGWMYQNGLGISADEIPQKDQIAVKWYRLAAEQGYAVAQYNLSLMYQNGLGISADEIPQKDQTAVKWLRLAAEQGYAAAQTHLGWMYQNGLGISADEIPQKDQIAVKRYRLAAEQGYAGAQSYLYWMYEQRRGIPADGSGLRKRKFASSTNTNATEGQISNSVAQPLPQQPNNQQVDNIKDKINKLLSIIRENNFLGMSSHLRGLLEKIETNSKPNYKPNAAIIKVCCAILRIKKEKDYFLPEIYSLIQGFLNYYQEKFEYYLEKSWDNVSMLVIAGMIRMGLFDFLKNIDDSILGIIVKKSLRYGYKLDPEQFMPVIDWKDYDLGQLEKLEIFFNRAFLRMEKLSIDKTKFVDALGYNHFSAALEYLKSVNTPYPANEITPQAAVLSQGNNTDDSVIINPRALLPSPSVALTGLENSGTPYPANEITPQAAVLSQENNADDSVVINPRTLLPSPSVALTGLENSSTPYAANEITPLATLPLGNNTDDSVDDSSLPLPSYLRIQLLDDDTNSHKRKFDSLTNVDPVEAPTMDTVTQPQPLEPNDQAVILSRKRKLDSREGAIDSGADLMTRLNGIYRSFIVNPKYLGLGQQPVLPIPSNSNPNQTMASKYTLSQINKRSARTESLCEHYVRTDSLSGHLYSSSKFSAENYQSLRVTFVFAGRGLDAFVPEESEGGKVILIVSKHQKIDLNLMVNPYCDVFVIDSLSSINEEDIGKITSRRIVAFLLMRYFHLIKPFFTLDDNIENISIFGPEKNIIWKDVYDLFLQHIGDATCLGMKAARPERITQSETPSIDDSTSNDKLGSKFFFFNSLSLRDLDEDGLRKLFPRNFSLWGEDVFLQFMLILLEYGVLILQSHVAMYERNHTVSPHLALSSLKESSADQRLPAWTEESEASYDDQQRIALSFLRKMTENSIRVHKQDLNYIIHADLAKYDREHFNQPSSLASNSLPKATLRSHQVKAIKLFNELTPGETGYIEAPTGSGKTNTMFNLAAAFLKNNPDKNVIITAPLQVLVDQLLKDAHKFNSQFQDNNPALNLDKIIRVSGSHMPMQILFINELVKKGGYLILCCGQSAGMMINKATEANTGAGSNSALDLLKTCSAFFIDEAHQSGINKEIPLLKKLCESHSIIGTAFSATIGDKAKGFGKEIFRYSRIDAVKDGIIRPWVIDLINEDDNGHVMEMMPGLMESRLHPMGNVLIDHKTVVYVPSIDEANELAETFNSHFKKTVAVTYTSRNDESTNNKNMERFSSLDDECQIIICVEMLKLGYDFPSLHTVIMLQRSKNSSSYQQALGRALRNEKSHPEKIAYFLTLTTASDALNGIERKSVGFLPEPLGPSSRANYNAFNAQPPINPTSAPSAAQDVSKAVVRAPRVSISTHQSSYGLLGKRLVEVEAPQNLMNSSAIDAGKINDSVYEVVSIKELHEFLLKNKNDRPLISYLPATESVDDFNTNLKNGHDELLSALRSSNSESGYLLFPYSAKAKNNSAHWHLGRIKITKTSDPSQYQYSCQILFGEAKNTVAKLLGITEMDSLKQQHKTDPANFSEDLINYIKPFVIEKPSTRPNLRMGFFDRVPMETSTSSNPFARQL